MGSRLSRFLRGLAAAAGFALVGMGAAAAADGVEAPDPGVQSTEGESSETTTSTTEAVTTTTVADATTTTEAVTTTTISEDDGDEDDGDEDEGAGPPEGTHGAAVSAAAQDHSNDERCGNHGRWVSSVARGEDDCTEPPGFANRPEHAGRPDHAGPPDGTGEGGEDETDGESGDE